MNAEEQKAYNERLIAEAKEKTRELAMQFADECVNDAARVLGTRHPEDMPICISLARIIADFRIHEMRANQILMVEARGDTNGNSFF